MFSHIGKVFFNPKETSNATITPTRILYADSLLIQQPTIVELTPQEYEEKFNCKYLEETDYQSFHFNGDVEDALADNTLQALEIIKTFAHRLLPENCLKPQQSHIDAYCAGQRYTTIIGDMGPKVGYGLFAGEDIPAGAILGSYVGDIKDVEQEDEFDPYNFRFEDYLISAKKSGNLTRFMQHLPLATPPSPAIFEYVVQATYDRIAMTPYLVDKTLVREELKAAYNKVCKEMPPSSIIHCHFKALEWANPQLKVATANILPTLLYIKNKPHVIFWTPCGISKGQLIGYDYGLQYWERLGVFPELFDRQGNTISSEHYFYKLSYLDQYHNKLTASLKNEADLSPRHLRYISKGFMHIIDKLEHRLTYHPNLNEKNRTNIYERIAICHRSLSRCFERLNNLKEAIKHCKSALTICIDQQLNEEAVQRTMKLKEELIYEFERRCQIREKTNEIETLTSQAANLLTLATHSPPAQEKEYLAEYAKLFYQSMAASKARRKLEKEEDLKNHRPNDHDDVCPIKAQGYNPFISS